MLRATAASAASATAKRGSHDEEDPFGARGLHDFLLSSLAYIACDDSSSAIRSPHKARAPGPTGGAYSMQARLPDGAPKDCFDNPKTHFEIINACTNATKITKNPTLTKLLPDGGLPPLD